MGLTHKQPRPLHQNGVIMFRVRLKLFDEICNSRWPKSVWALSLEEVIKGYNISIFGISQRSWTSEITDLIWTSLHQAFIPPQEWSEE